jgi:hypothetical protein
MYFGASLSGNYVNTIILEDFELRKMSQTKKLKRAIPGSGKLSAASNVNNSPCLAISNHPGELSLLRQTPVPHTEIVLDISGKFINTR